MGYWFPAKRHGWGWDLPITWQGWVVFGLYHILLVGGGIVLTSERRMAAFVAYAIGLGLAMACILWLKGEPARWR